MKKIILTITLALISICSFAQEKAPEVYTAKDSLMFSYMDVYMSQLREPRYKLYPTQNNWNFIKLDTMTGQLSVVQFSLEAKNRGEYTLDDNERIYSWDEKICGRFVLYETKNIYNFILLDTINGKAWQVQWGFKSEDMMVVRIY